jgi:hypothetical protein
MCGIANAPVKGDVIGNERMPCLVMRQFEMLPHPFVKPLENGVDRGRRLGDEWAKTRVLVEQKPAPPEEE